MKNRLILLVFGLMLGVAMQAQDLTRTFKMQPAQTYYEYDGRATDVMNAAGDTLDYIFYLNNDAPFAYDISWKLDTIDGADTIYSYSIDMRMTENDSWTQITTATASAVASTQTTTLTSNTTSLLEYYTTAEDSVFLQTATIVSGNSKNIYSVKSNSYHYRWVRIRLIKTYADATGAGVSLNYIWLKYWNRL